MQLALHNRLAFVSVRLKWFTQIILQKIGITWTQVKVCAFCLNYPTWRKVKHLRMIKATIRWQTYIPEVMKTGSANLTLGVTFHNFSCQMLACLLCCSQLMSVFWPVFWLGICVEVDVDIITTPTAPIFFVAKHNSLFNTSDSYLKSVHA